MSVYIIAEAGVNHNGSLDMACRLVDAAAAAGADAVKFQTFRAASLVTQNARKAPYQIANMGASDESQRAMLEKLELDEAAHVVLREHCERRGIEFLSTPFDEDSVDLLARMGVRRMKIPSGELTNAPLLLKVARTGLPIILSTGMATLEEIEQALSVLAFGMLRLENPSRRAFAQAFASPEGQARLRRDVALLHCTTEYPAPLDQVNLRAMVAMETRFSLATGYSDHTAGIAIPVAAAALGACIIEKHFTLDRNLPGPDHKASLEPDELVEMVRKVRQVEVALGSDAKAPTPAEARNAVIARRSLVALRPIAAGELFTAENLGARRPGNGLSPMYYHDLLGTKAKRAYQAEEAIEP